MPTVCVIQGHPDSGGRHLCHAIADAYATGAKSVGADVRHIDIAAADFPLLRRPEDFLIDPPADIQACQKVVMESDHLVVVSPLWLGAMPAIVKGFFEQLSRHEFAIANNPKGGWPVQKLKGKSARVIVTMGMPAMAYRLFFGAHGVKGFEGGILGMAGVKPVRETLIGGVGALNAERSAALLARMRRLGARLG